MAEMTPRVIVALDVPSQNEASALVARLGERCDFYKVGSQLFTAAGPDVVRGLREQGKDVFLDLKFHDIPNTVRGAARSAAVLGANLLTVHATGGVAMMEAAVEGAGERCHVLAVTVLTSFDAAGLGRVWDREVANVQDEVLRLAGLARSAGVAGIVCSGREAAAVRHCYGTTLKLLVPGIRLPGGSAHDQARVVTPAEAIAAGASYLVLGRAVTQASDPAAAMAQVTASIA
jgi:orotidine-5'-phosphate decarboxylase